MLFPCYNNVVVLSVLWGLHGCVQGLGWPGCTNIMKSWYTRSEIATWWSILTSAGNIGAMATPVVVANIAFYFGWESAFYLIGTVASITAVLLWLLIKDSPIQPANASSPTTSTANRKVKDHSYSAVIFNLDIWIICLSCFTFTVLRYCVSDWSQLYFVEAADLTEAKSKISTVTVFSIVHY